MTAGYRPLKEPLRREGIDPGKWKDTGGRAYWLDPDTGRYRQYDAEAYRRLAGSSRRQPSRKKTRKLR
jgi:hypothetical protein